MNVLPCCADYNLRLILRRLRVYCLWIWALVVTSMATVSSGNVRNGLGNRKHRHTGMVVFNHWF